MDERERFRFYHPIEVRYGDIDAQGHVNNAKIVTYMETARFKYLERVGLLRPGTPWGELGIIIAEIQCSYKAPVIYPEIVHAYVRTAQIGNKSFTFHYLFERPEDGTLLALGRSVQVAYDYRTGQSQPVPEDWRAKIRAFEEGADPA